MMLQAATLKIYTAPSAQKLEATPAFQSVHKLISYLLRFVCAQCALLTLRPAKLLLTCVRRVLRKKDVQKTLMASRKRALPVDECL